MIRRPAIGLLALVFRRLAGLSSDNLVNDSEGRLSRLSDSRLEFLLGKIAERARLFGEVLMDALRLERRALVPWGIRYPTGPRSVFARASAQSTAYFLRTLLSTPRTVPFSLQTWTRTGCWSQKSRR